MFLSILSCLAIIFILFLYSLDTSPDSSAFLSASLYNFAIAVLISFFVCITTLILGTVRTLYVKEANKINSSIHYLQIPFKQRNYRWIFILSSIIYFAFFGLLTNMFIFFNEDGTVYSIIPLINQETGGHNSSLHSDHSILGHESDYEESIKALQSDDLDIHAAHPQHQAEITELEKQETSLSKFDDMIYPTYRLVICCNSFGYVPMAIFYLSSNFSFLMIPLNFFLGVTISLLVGINVTLNIFLFKRLRISYGSSVSKRSIFSGLGLSSGLLVGCPTCAGSLLYSLVGFSSLVTFSSLGLYQIFFIIISIPFLIGSIIVTSRLVRNDYCKLPPTKNPE